jgi:hypothetical protein
MRVAYLELQKAPFQVRVFFCLFVRFLLIFLVIHGVVPSPWPARHAHQVDMPVALSVTCSQTTRKVQSLIPRTYPLRSPRPTLSWRHVLLSHALKRPADIFVCVSPYNRLIPVSADTRLVSLYLFICSSLICYEFYKSTYNEMSFISFGVCIRSTAKIDSLRIFISFLYCFISQEATECNLKIMSANFT